MSEVSTEDGLFEVLDAQTFVRRWLPETAGGIPLVLLHDSLGSVEQWRDFPALLARRLQRPVVAYDRPGFGRSSPRTGAPSLDFIAEEAQAHFPALRDALGLCVRAVRA